MYSQIFSGIRKRSGHARKTKQQNKIKHAGIIHNVMQRTSIMRDDASTNLCLHKFACDAVENTYSGPLPGLVGHTEGLMALHAYEERNQL